MTEKVGSFCVFVPADMPLRTVVCNKALAAMVASSGMDLSSHVAHVAIGLRATQCSAGEPSSKKKSFPLIENEAFSHEPYRIPIGPLIKVTNFQPLEKDLGEFCLSHFFGPKQIAIGFL